jgi:hypothetical protein
MLQADVFEVLFMNELKNLTTVVNTFTNKEAAQKPETETHYIQYVFCFNSNISNLHNNDFKIDIIKNVVGTVLFVKVFTTVVK